MSDLKGKVALVTGGSRGIGKGIAVALGKRGMVVYVTGRTRPGEEAFCRLGGSVDETAALVDEAGGQGVAVYCDHADDGQTQRVFEKIEAEQGRLELLVNNAWGGYQRMQRKLEEALEGKKSRGKMVAGMEEAFGEFTNTFWELPLEDWDGMNRVGARSHYVAAVLAARLMTGAKGGLIVNLTADVSEIGGQVAYGMAKAGVDRMTADTAAQLRDSGVAVVGLRPGMVLTEMFEERFRKGFLDEGDYARFEAPASVGRCVVALAQDGAVLEKTGQVLGTKEVATAYGLEVLDGRHVEL